MDGIVDYSITSLELAEQLDVSAIDRDPPKALRMDISTKAHQWRPRRLGQRNRKGIHSAWLTLAHNGYVESFKWRMRDQSLNINKFYTLNNAKGVIGL